MPNYKEAVQFVFTELPQEQEKIPDLFFLVPPEDLLEESAISYETSPGVVNSGEPFIKDILEELEKFKDKLGGSPGFGNHRPTLDENDAKKTFFGVPMSAVKDWYRMTLEKEWKPKFIWRDAAKLFNVTTENTSQYEDSHIRIQRFGLLMANKERFEEILERKDEKLYSEFSSITGLAWHPKQNNPSVEKAYIDLTGQFLTEYFKDAKERGEGALIEYFTAFKGVCFEDRARLIEEYIIHHPLKGAALDEVALQAKNTADYSSDNTLKEMFVKEATEIFLNRGAPATPKELWQHLIDKGANEIEFYTDSNKTSKAKPTLEALNEIVEELIDDCILDEEEVSEVSSNDINPVTTENEEIEEEEHSRTLNL